MQCNVYLDKHFCIVWIAGQHVRYTSYQMMWANTIVHYTAWLKTPLCVSQTRVYNADRFSKFFPRESYPFVQ